MKRAFYGVAAAVLISALAGQATALTIVSDNGAYTVGIGAGGELFDGGPYVGMRRNADGYDPISPGTPRDSWGLNSNYADGAYTGYNGVSTIFSGGGSTLTATTTTTDGFTVVMDYSFVGSDQNILQIRTAVTNNGTSAQGALFQRNVDWDPPATFFNETFGPIGSFGLVAETSYFGFEDAAGNGAYTSVCGASCDQYGDFGAGIRLNLGTLNVGQTSGFNYFYGLNSVGDNVNDLIGDAQLAGASFLLAGQSGENGMLPSLGAEAMILGVGAVSTGGVPEPATWAMMLLGFFGAGTVVRRRRLAVA